MGRRHPGKGHRNSYDAVRDKGGSAGNHQRRRCSTPAMMIGKLLGFGKPIVKLKHWSETTIALGNWSSDYFNEVGMTSTIEFAGAQPELFESKKSCPADDIFSFYTTAEVDGCPFDPNDAIAGALLLLDGGAETRELSLPGQFST